MRKDSHTQSVLIAGGAGFIGSHMVDYWVKRGAKVFVVDNLSTGKREWLPSSVEWYEFDLNKTKRLQEVLLKHQPDVIHHFAGHTRLRDAIKNPLHDADDNLGTVLSLIQSLLSIKKNNNYQPKQIVFSSTAAIYGGVQQPPFTEQTPVCPVTPYGVAKLAAEQYLTWYGQLTGVAVTILRYSNVYGPRQSAWGESGVIAKFLDAFIHEQPLTLYGDGKHRRDYIHVDDVVAANAAVVNKSCVGTFTVGTGVPTATIELAQLVQQMSLSPCKVQQIDAPVLEQADSWFDSRELQRSAHWKPMIPLKKGIKNTLDWYRNHEH